MLNVLRESFKETPYLKWVLILVGFSMVFYLGSYFVGESETTGGTRWVARVNGNEIPESRYREIAKNLDAYYRNMFGASYEQIKPQLRIGRQALDTLIEREVVLQDAARIGLRASASEVAQQVRNHPELQDANGRFIGKERYKQVLERGYPGGFVAFERNLGDDVVQARWTALVTQPVSVSDEELAKIFRERTEKTSIDYVLFASADQVLDREVDDAELRRWYDEHLEDYQRTAGRKIRYAVIDRDSRLGTVEVSADEIRAHYEGDRASYAHLEQRRARHILLELPPGATEEDKQAVRSAAEGALERLRGGADFAALAAELSDDTVSAGRGGDLDFFARGQMLPPFEDAAFSTPVGQLAPLTETAYGFHVIEVTDSRPAGQTPLEDVEGDIRRLLSLRKVDSGLAEEAQRLLGEMGGAERFAEIASGAGLTVVSAFFNETERLGTLGPSPDFRAAVGAQQPGTVSAPLRVAAGLALVVVDELLPAGPAPFEDARSGVQTALLAQRSRDAARAAASAALERDKELAKVARALGLERAESAELGPGQLLPRAGGPSEELEQALFGADASPGRRGVASLPDGAVVFEITGREPFTAARFAAEKEQLREETLRERRERYRQAVLERLRGLQKVDVNPVWAESLDGAG